jgi:exo-beta-1,3-glucanase (GH17 family)
MRIVGVVLMVGLATLLHAAGWSLTHDRVSPPNVVGQLTSVSFSPFPPGSDGASDTVTKEQISSDLAVVAPYVRAVRTYSVGNGLALVPELAAQFGVHVTLGAWIDEGNDRNEREIETAIALTKHHRNIDSIIVGNETLYRSQVRGHGPTVKDLIDKIQRVKREVSVPVTTAEVWDVWLDHPELASAVDYLAVHILPYWEGLPSSTAVDQAHKV